MIRRRMNESIYLVKNGNVIMRIIVKHGKGGNNIYLGIEGDDDIKVYRGEKLSEIMKKEEINYNRKFLLNDSRES